ncbi:MAG: TIM barrel protein [Bacteroides sp.]|nr:TIM barrel protein [Eubacterium sp.]MCM1418565.1 TIM barrel protein [Roseburia sp.]MCM1462620.1 TIM barrel protein [Bacteroides sp.]
MITFGPGGNSESFGRRKFPEELPDYLKSFGLNGYEIECGRGVRIAEKTYELLPALAAEHKINLTLHAPYFISLSSENEETRLKSVPYLLESARAAHRLGVRKIVVHSGSCAKMTREAALALAKDTLTRAQAALDEEGLTGIVLCPETMGKINQLGTLSEVLELCTADERFLPCIDFGHLNARTLGGIKTREDYAAILDEIEDKLGFERLKRMHVHFSKIQYTAGGEKCHLTFADKEYGPEYEPLMELFVMRGLEPSVISESAGTQAEDAAAMKRAYEGFLTQ